MNEPKKLYRSRTNRMVSGLCAGFGKYIGWDPTLVRVIYAVATIILGGVPIVIYLVLVMVVPQEPTSEAGKDGGVVM